MIAIDWGAVWEIILSGMDPAHFIAYFLLMCGGAVVYFGMDVRQSMKKDAGTPVKFSLGFMVRDNLVRLISVLILIAAAVVFYEDFFGAPINAKLAFMQGIGIDALMGIALKEGKERGPLKRNREKLMQKYG